MAHVGLNLLQGWLLMAAVSGWVLGTTLLALVLITSVPLLAALFGFEPLDPLR